MNKGNTIACILAACLFSATAHGDYRRPVLPGERIPSPLEQDRKAPMPLLLKKPWHDWPVVDKDITWNRAYRRYESSWTKVRIPKDWPPGKLGYHPGDVRLILHLNTPWPDKRINVTR